MKNKILVLDDEANMRHMLKVLLEKNGYAVDVAPDGIQGLSLMETGAYDFVLCDLKMPKMDGMTFLRKARHLLENTTLIMMSAFGTIDEAVKAMKIGAFDFISKPFKPDEILLTLKKASETDALKKENKNLKKKIQEIEHGYFLENIVSISNGMKSVLALAHKAADYKTTVLLLGESGTGKELVARGIHYSGNRSQMPFIPVNCGGIPDTLLESEMFGYRKGAFSGADTNKKGLFEEAHKGTIFLDEISELPLSLQVKLLRVLQENEIRPIGEAHARKIDVRVIAATAQKLDEEVQQKRFREDLYFRLNVLQIKLPALKDRVDDIPLLCDHFVKKYNQVFHKNITQITPQAIRLLVKQTWPGNVRELENAVERAILLAEGDVLDINDFQIEAHSYSPACSLETIFDGFSIKVAQKFIEKHLITKALEKTGANRTQAARLLEISHPSLLSKMKEYKIEM